MQIKKNTPSWDGYMMPQIKRSILLAKIRQKKNGQTITDN